MNRRSADLSPVRRPAGAFSLVEVLVAAAVLVSCGAPVVALAGRSVEDAARQRVRLAAEALACDTLEWFAAMPGALRSSSGAGPTVYRDPWLGNPGLYRAFGHRDPSELTRRFSLHLDLTLRPEVAPGADQLSCRITWSFGSPGHRIEEKIEHALLLVTRAGP